jgi:hypothetical protein
MNRVTSRLFVFLVACVALGLQEVNAATVSWSAQSATTSNLDIVNPGSVVQAINFGTTGGPGINVTVGADVVLFAPDSGAGFSNAGNGGFFNAAATTVAADFESVLDSFAFNNNRAVNTSRTFNGLTDGGTYTLQPFASDDRNHFWAGFILDIEGVASAPLSNPGGGDPNGTNFSPFSVATVVLDAGQTSFTVDIIGEVPSNVLNALVLAEAPVSVPEPATATLALLGLGGLMMRRRRAC